MKLDGSDFKKVTWNNFNDMWPSFSQDDKSIYFQSDREGNQEIYCMDIDGSNVKIKRTFYSWIENNIFL